jgi:uncharacterized repeat protein (TIGR03803 family)
LTATVQILYSFGRTSTDAIGAGLSFEGSDGDFYGVSSGGLEGNTGIPLITTSGTVFKITPTGEETVLHLFAGAPDDGAVPQVLIQGSDGNFYGTTEIGGANNAGTVFKLTPEDSETILYSFAAGNGPSGGLVQGSDGNFYGTSGGGANDLGTFFKLTPEGVETTLYSFRGGSDGWLPVGQLVQGGDGNFYGTTVYGGAQNCPDGQTETSCGTVFKVTPEGVETILYSGPDVPVGGLIQGSDGNLYWTLGGVLELTPEGVETILYNFSNSSVFVAGPGTLIQGSHGNFYGTTSGGGVNDGGTVFQVTPAGVFTLLYSFPKGAEPGGLVQGSDGNFYGTTGAGGAYDKGYFFKLVLSSP